VALLNPFVRSRAERATAVLPQTAQAALFSITGGRVAISQIVGEFTVAANATATNLSLVHNPTTGTDVAICAVVAIASKEIGTLLGITGVTTEAMLAAGQVLSGQNKPVMLKPGTLDALTSASNATASVKWTVYWAPIDAGASLQAA
jgi:hypothetical protein